MANNLAGSYLLKKNGISVVSALLRSSDMHLTNGRYAKQQAFQLNQLTGTLVGELFTVQVTVSC